MYVELLTSGCAIEIASYFHSFIFISKILFAPNNVINVMN
jgi:hypothetical protein